MHTAPTHRATVLTGRSVLAVLAIALVALTLTTATASAAAPSGFVGLQSWRDPTTTHLAKLREAKVGVFRMQVSWKSVDRKLPNGSHRYVWSRYDPIFESAAKRGVRILPVLLGSPDWANPDSRWPPRGAYARRAFNRFATAVVKRYGPRGDFWDTRASYAKPATHWQIWNEPNLPNYWNNKPNPREYASLVIGAADAARDGAAANRAARSSVRIVTAGLPWASSSRLPKPPDFLRGVFSVSGASSAVDVVAVHPYARTPAQVTDLVRSTRSTLRGISKAAGAKPLWLTEVGWATGGGSSSFSVSSTTQARYLTDVYKRLLAIRSSSNVTGAMWFNLLDVRPPRGKSDAWYYHTGGAGYEQQAQALVDVAQAGHRRPVAT
jgi:polysaccharide biosynthesis protein PslG